MYQFPHCGIDYRFDRFPRNFLLFRYSEPSRYECGPTTNYALEEALARLTPVWDNPLKYVDHLTRHRQRP